MVLTKWSRDLIVAMALCLLSISLAHAQWNTRTIGDPLPQELKERAVALLRTVRPNDFEAALAGAKVMDGEDWRRLDFLLMRIEANCLYRRCMTMVLRVTDRELIPELTLQAGRRVIFTDVGEYLWQSREGWFPLLFESGRGVAIEAFRRDGTWVVSAEPCESCFGDDEREPPRPPPPPSPKPPERRETFEDFQSWLKEQR